MNIISFREAKERIINSTIILNDNLGEFMQAITHSQEPDTEINLSHLVSGEKLTFKEEYNKIVVIATFHTHQKEHQFIQLMDEHKDFHNLQILEPVKLT